MTDIYPPFTATEVHPDYVEMFDVVQVYQPQPKSRIVLSTSLYHGERGAKGGFMNKYVMPLLAGMNQTLPEGWSMRLYLSADLEYMVRGFPKHVEVHVMKNKSWTSIPGMLWRYLPITENVFCMARGADNFTLHQWEVDAAKRAVESQAQLYRHVWNPPNINSGKHFLYRPIRGTCGIQGPLPFLEHATQWIALNKAQKLPQEVGSKIHFGLNKWDSFGQDEQFLCRWLYHYMTGKRILSRVSPTTEGFWFSKDLEHLLTSGSDHHLL